MQHEGNIMWRRLDRTGMDACSVERTGDGYSVSGTALFIDGGKPCRFGYSVSCDSGWVCRSAEVSGRAGDLARSLVIDRTPDGGWSVNGGRIEADGLKDIDLGFTPATNTCAIRRLNLQPGETGESTALWLNDADWSFRPLRQIYKRVSESAYFYASPAHGFETTLTVDETGLVCIYPTLWEAVAPCPEQEGVEQ